MAELLQRVSGKAQKETAEGLTDFASIPRITHIESKRKWRKIRVKTETELKLDRLYKLLEELESQNRTDDAGALRWAIFQLEQK